MSSRLRPTPYGAGAALLILGFLSADTRIFSTATFASAADRAVHMPTGIQPPRTVCPGVGPAGNPPEAPARGAVVQFANQTDCPIHVYLEGRYLGCCEAFGVLRADEERTGDLILVGRFRCDRWGPTVLRIRPGGMIRHSFTEGDRVTRGR